MPAGLAEVERRKRRKRRAQRERGSSRHAKARRRVAALQARAARIRQDWRHKASLDIARRFATVVLEDLATHNMTRSARGTVDAPWHGFGTVLAYKLEERGGYLCRVDPRHTSQTCSACGAVDRESRESQASFRCRQCGLRAQCCNQHPASEHGV